MRRAKDAGTLLAPIGVAALAIVCCAGLPSLAGLAGGLTLAAVLGLGGGLVVLIAALAVTMLTVRARRRRGRRPDGRGPAP
jgi:hypothetical protein